MRILSLILFLSLFASSISLDAQETYQKPELSNPDSWSLILLPDPQTYMKFGRNQPIFDLMTAWISENIDPLNIKMVLCTGDLVEQNDMVVPDKINGNLPSKQQWEAISSALEPLDGKVPYILAAGNHDFGFKNIEHRKSNYDQYFPADRNWASQKLLKAVGKNFENRPTLENAAYEFISPHNRKFLFINLEFAPRDAMIAWAKEVADQESFKEHTVVLLTHSYLNAQHEHIEKENYPITDGNYGKAIWEKLVQPSQNIQLVFSGHIGGADDFEAHIGFRKDRNASGKQVTQMAFNAQAMGGGWHGNGGDGWLRILEFLPDGKTVKVRTFSPYFAISPSTWHLAWSTAAFNTFTFELD